MVVLVGGGGEREGDGGRGEEGRQTFKTGCINHNFVIVFQCTTPRRSVKNSQWI